MRPKVITKKLKEDILFRVMSGESLRQIASDAKMPARSTIHKTLAEDTDFSDQYAKACDIRADEIFDEMFEIADDGSNDWMLKKQGEDDVEVLNHEHVSRSRLRIDTRKWALARMAPKKYGDKVQVGGDGDSPIIHEIRRTIVSPDN